MVRIQSRASYVRSLLWEVFQEYHDQQWVITDFRTSVRFEHTFRPFLDVYTVIGSLYRRSQRLDVSFTINGMFRIGHARDTDAQRYKALVRSLSLTMSLIEYVVTHYPVRFIRFSAADIQDKRLRIYDRLARIIARKFHGRVSSTTARGAYFITLLGYEDEEGDEEG